MNDKENFDTLLDSFHEYLCGILALYQKVVPVLKAELDAIMSDQIETLNESLKSQQALLLKTKSFETQVADYLKKLGIEASNLTEMVQQLPEDQKLRFFGLLGEFELTITEVNFYKEKCRVLLQSKLYSIDKVLSRLDVPKDITTYNNSANEIHGTIFSKSFEKKV